MFVTAVTLWSESFLLSGRVICSQTAREPEAFLSPGLSLVLCEIVNP